MEIKIVWPVGDFIREEMEIRGWDENKVLTMIPDPVLRLAFSLILNTPTKGMILGNELATELSRIFGSSKKYWINLDRIWQEKLE